MFKRIVIAFAFVLAVMLFPTAALGATSGKTVKENVSALLYQEGALPGSARDLQFGAAGSGAAVNELYDRLYRAMINEETKLTVSDLKLDRDTVFNTYYHVINEHGRLFYVSGGYSWSATTGGYVGVIYPQYEGTPEERAAKRLHFEETVDRIVSYANKADSDIGKIFWANNYLCDHAEFDGQRIHYDAYSLLVEGKGVCQGYMLAFGVLMDSLGIENTYALSPADKMNHTWNMVKVNGNYYHIDVTWNDTTLPGSRQQYFLCSDEMFINKNHYGWESTADAPDTRYDDYFWTKAAGVTVLGTKIYYIEEGTNGATRTIKCWDSDVDHFSTLTSFTARWTLASDPDNPGRVRYYYNYFGTMCEYRNCLIYIVPKGVDAISLVDGEITELMRIDDNGCLYNCYFENGKLYYSVGSDVNNMIRSGVWEIAFPGGFIKYDTAILPTGLRSIWDSAFEGSAFERIIIPEGCESIGDGAFSNSSALHTVVAPESISFIGEGAFDGCADPVFVTPMDSYAWEWAILHGYDTRESLEP